MATTNYTSQDIVQALRDALGSALDNLPDVAADATFGRQELAECCADIAALSHLLAPEGGTGPVNILAYLA